MNAIQERLCGHYGSLLKRHYSDDPHLAVGWGSHASQMQRFAVLHEAVSAIEAATVLDVGCGLGDYASHWTGLGYNAPLYSPGYTGIDLVPAMIERAKARHPKHEFLVCDLTDGMGPRRWCETWK